MADETTPVVTPEVPAEAPKAAPKAKAKEPKLAANQTLMLSGNVYTAH
ncbi:hypothetical protein [Mesorhizobium sp.]|nr:hypothetical protein [Mesorhizobium sp.]